eukprot:Gregarina_sp_Poly_1__7180@NODE_393_length_8957_cov_1164_871316_g322_i0_p3_GENE_NODE_393_length_8957_cov_1164_871316_g322_i0NODE_393_length_8957_cov_1164_871316_g322_i0_p3_ORF_typecomplete_len536_score87_08Integrin_beta/PF00362_18/1_7e14Integrin_beta/PF00362_18/0_46Mucin15/PF15672_5/0_0032VWA/PF00092_28/0_022VWA/PF00092_28/1_1e04Sporozoite_P67/PF05642_11/0_31DUF3482/PF11981_8/0_36PRCC/PF10253_9/6_5e03PRCC/PF10253_9/1_6Podoplanin/PF05808_11/20_NODE_393_length_8957_cov_1164_871316_g322_i0621669
MKFPTSFFSAFALLAAGEDECKYALEILALQDASNSFTSQVRQWATTAENLLARLSEEFGEYKIGLSSFTDKPIPYSGYGGFGGYSGISFDYCYASQVPLTKDPAEMVAGLYDLMGTMGSGADIPEAQAEAMIYAALDDSVGWSAPEVTHSESGRPIARILMLITDVRSHEAGNARDNIAGWNWPRSYPNGYESNSTGGFGSHEFAGSPIVDVRSDENKAAYFEMADLFRKADAMEAGVSTVALTDNEIARLQELIDYFGPYPWPELEYPVHPGDNSIPDCSKVEYPTLEVMAETLMSRNIVPVFMASDPTGLAFYEWYQTNSFAPMGWETVVTGFNADTLFDDMIAAVSKIVEQKCLTTTSTSAPTEKPTDPVIPPKPTEPVVEPTEPAVEPTEAPVQPTAPPAKPTEAPVQPTKPVVKPTEPVVEPTEPAKEPTEEEEDETTMLPIYESTTEEELQPPIVAPPVEGSNTGTIAGATAGAAAGLAAVGALLYKTVGFGMLGGGSPAITGVEQMEVPDSPVEREAMEEVTMDMFH